MKRRITILLVLTALIAAGVYWYRRYARVPKPRTELVLSGNIEAHESLVSFQVQGRIVRLPVQEGEAVEKGALLARLDDDDYKQQVRIDEARVHVSDSNLSLALAGSREQEISAAQQNMLEAQADMQQKKLDYDRARNLFSEDAISAQDRDRADTAFKRSQANYNATQQKYSELVEGTRKEDIAIAKAQLNEAKATLGRSRVNLDYTVLQAPMGGVITVRQAELGEVVFPGTPVVTIADLDHLWLRGYVAETDLGHIRWGQGATITTDTYPGKRYHGRITFIASNAEFTPKSVQTFKERVTLVYRIKIDIENPNHELKPGMPADAHIAFSSSTAPADAGRAGSRHE